MSPDMTMCKGTKCPMKKNCLRYLADPNPTWQAYFTETPYMSALRDCDYFADARTDKKDEPTETE